MRVPRVALCPSDLLRAGGEGPTPVAPGDAVSVRGDPFLHLTRVLRVGPGDRFVAASPAGEEWALRVLAVFGDRLHAEVVDIATPSVEPAVAVVLATAVPRGERMDWLVEKATELGVGEIVPLVADRSVVRPEEGGNRLRRWGRLAQAATAQCGRLRPPQVRPPSTLAAALAALPGPWLFALERSGTVGLAAAAVPVARCPRVVWAVGPEGGWTPREVDAALAAGAVAVSLGPRILRVETAAVAGLAVLMAALGEMAPPPELAGVSRSALAARGDGAGDVVP